MGTTLNMQLTVTRAITFAPGTVNQGTVTTPSATFNGDSTNSGTINGNAQFNDNSTNTGTVSGNAQFNDCAEDEGDVTGNVTPGTTNNPQECPGYQLFSPPLKAEWITSGRKRRLVCLGSSNPDQLSLTIYGGSWQPCPPGESCFAYPALYRARVSFELDYEKKPNYLDHPGNPM